MRRVLLHDVPRSAASSRGEAIRKVALSPSGAFRKASQFGTLDVPGAELYRRQWDQRGVPIATEKKQRTWPEGPVSRRFTFSKPVFDGLIRELAFESGYREPRARRIAWSLPEGLGTSRLPSFTRRLAWEDRCFLLRCYRKPRTLSPAMASRRSSTRIRAASSPVRRSLVC